jgi:LCP family protein required for cell wall assembly
VARSKRKVTLVALASLVLMLLGVGGGWAAYLNQQIDDMRRITVDFGPDRAPRQGTSEGREDRNGTDSTSQDGSARSGDLTETTKRAEEQSDKSSEAKASPGAESDDADSTDQAEPLTILVVGVDAGAGPRIADDLTDGEWTPGRYRSDTIMVVHLSADRRSAHLVSIPRDSWVRVPGHGMRRINAAFSLGGPSLSVETVERLTGVDVDHLMVVDWKAFKRITTAIGGVPVRIPADVYDPSQDVRWKAGTHVLAGERALQYVRQRHGLPRGDFSRIHRQQNFVRATLAKVLSNDTLLNPVKVTKVLQAVGDHLLVDDGLSSADLRRLALSTRGLNQDSLRFLTIPTTALDRVAGKEIVRVDRARTRRLFSALTQDKLDRYLRRHNANRLDDAGRVR